MVYSQRAEQNQHAHHAVQRAEQQTGCKGSRSCIQGGKGYKAVKKQEKSGIKSSGQIIPLQVHLLNKMQFSPDLAKNGIGSANYKIAKHYK